MRVASGPEHRVAHRAHHVQGLLVTELPRPRGPGGIAGGAGVADVVASSAAGVELGEDLAQRGGADPADRAGGQLERTATVPDQVALLEQLALDAAQRGDIVDGPTAERPLHRRLVHVLERGAGVVLTQGGLEVVEVGQLLERRRRIPHAHALLAAHPLLAAPGQVRPGVAEGVAELGQLRGEVQVHGALHQLAELLALLRGQGVHQLLLGGGPPGEVVDELGEVLGLGREELPVPLHERLELLLRVLALRVGLEHRVEVGQHVLDRLHRSRVRLLQRVLHALELAVQDLAAQEVVDLLERRAGLGTAPVVRLERGHRAGGVGRQGVQLELGHAGAVIGVGEQRGPFELERLLEQLAHLLQGPVELPLLAGLPLTLGDLTTQVVQPAQAVGALAQQVAQRLAGAGAVQHRLADGVQRRRDVVRRLEGVASTGPRAVAEPAHPRPSWALR